MTSMSHDPAAAVIGAQTIEIGTRALAAGATAAASVTGLAPAGAEEISAQATAAFAAEAAAVLAAHTAAQEEIMRAGAALIDIARMYAQVDGEAAGTLVSSANEISNQAFATGASVGAGLARAEALPGALGAAACTPLMTNLVEGVAASNPSTTVPAVANAASTVLGAGTAPLSSIGQFASAGGAAGPGLTSGPELASSLDQNQDKDDTDKPGEEQPGDEHPGESLL
jgi:PE family